VVLAWGGGRGELGAAKASKRAVSSPDEVTAVSPPESGAVGIPVTDSDATTPIDSAEQFTHE
jgi:hypothetical protein